MCRHESGSKGYVSAASREHIYRNVNLVGPEKLFCMDKRRSDHTKTIIFSFLLN
jgi:hypothetical protein